VESCLPQDRCMTLTWGTRPGVGRGGAGAAASRPGRGGHESEATAGSGLKQGQPPGDPPGRASIALVPAPTVSLPRPIGRVGTSPSPVRPSLPKDAPTDRPRKAAKRRNDGPAFPLATRRGHRPNTRHLEGDLAPTAGPVRDRPFREAPRSPPTPTPGLLVSESSSRSSNRGELPANPGGPGRSFPDNQLASNGGPGRAGRAGGTGGSLVGGRGFSGGDGGGGRGGGADALSGFFAAVRSRVEASKRYPTWARRQGIEGRATVSFSLSPTGALLSAKTCRTSGSAELDAAAVDAVRRGAPYPSPPPGTDGSLTITITFILDDN